MASLQDSSLEEEQFTAAMQAQGLRHSAAATALPLSHGAARKWFYKDPQGEIQGARGQWGPCQRGCWGQGDNTILVQGFAAQLSDRGPPSLGPGPFTTQEMAEWFQAGYFSMALLVKRGCDEGFQPLGEVIKMWGRVPFAPGPSPPPLLVSPAALARSGEGRLEPRWGRRAEGPSHRRAVGLAQGNMDQERLKKQQELAAAALYQQLQHQQFLQLVGRYGAPGRPWRPGGLRAGGPRPPDARVWAHSRQLPQCALREKAALGDLSPPQQQLTAFLQQLQALKPPRFRGWCLLGARGADPRGARSSENPCSAPQRRGPEPAPDHEPVLVGARFGPPLGHTYLSLITVRCVARLFPVPVFWAPPRKSLGEWGGFVSAPAQPEPPAAAALASAGGEASLWDIPINSSTQGPILEQLQLQHKVSRLPGAGVLGRRGPAQGREGGGAAPRSAA